MTEDKTRVLIAVSSVSQPVFETILTTLGIPFSFCDSSNIAEKAKTTLPGAIIIEHSLTGTGSLDIIKSLKANPATGSLPIIYITEPQAAETRLKAIDAGIDEFLIQPVDVAELKIRIKSVIKVRAYKNMSDNITKTWKPRPTRGLKR